MEFRKIAQQVASKHHWPVFAGDIWLMSLPTWASASQVRSPHPDLTPELVIVDYRGGIWTLDPNDGSWHPSGFPEKEDLEPTDTIQ